MRRRPALGLRASFGIAAAFMVGVFAVGAVPGPNLAAATSRVGQAPIDIRLVSQDAATPLEGTLRLRLRITGALGAFEALEVRVVAHPRIESLDELERTAMGEDLGGLKDAVELPLADLARFANGDVVAPVTLQPLDEEFDFTKLNITSAGVYPIEILVRDAEESELARTISWLVATAPETAPTVRFAWIATVAAAPDVEDDGVTPTESFIASTAPGRRLARAVETIGDSGFPFSVVTSPQTLEAWSRAADRNPDAASTFERAREVLASPDIELLPVPYVPVDGPALERATLGSRLADSYLDGAQALQDVLGRRPDPAAVFADPIDPGALDRLSETFAYQAVVPATAVAGGVTDAPFTLRGETRSFNAVATRPDLQALLLDTTDANALPGARSHRWFTAVALAARAIDTDDGTEAPLPVVFTTGRDDSLDPALLSALRQTLADQPIVDPVVVSDLFGPPASGEGRSVNAPAPDAEPDPVTALDVIAAERTMASFVSFVGDDHPAVLAHRANLRLVVSADLTPAEIRARLALLDRAVAEFVAGIGTEIKQVTLTDRRSTIPLSFRNDTEREVDVKVTLVSPKLVFPGPGGASQTITLPPGRNTQAMFDVEARASGRFTMDVIITSADGNPAVFAPTEITVSSAVFGSIGTWLTYGAVAFLALWWAHHLWKSRRRPANPTAAR